MSSDNIQIMIAMTIYIIAVFAIGLKYAKEANQSMENYVIGGRSLGPWVTAMGASASDMSGWLLMGLPGLAYWTGFGEAFWTAVGLFIGTYLNWLFVAKRLRNYSTIADNSITIPDFFSNRFKEDKKVLAAISAIFIIIFFTVYAASGFVTVGKLFNSLFELDYVLMMILGAVFVVGYTFIGGFLAESASDFMQGIVMVVALVLVLVFGVYNAGGVGQVIQNAQDIPGFLEFFGVASPTVENGVQVVENGVPLFNEAEPYGAMQIISNLAWGLGYFGMPHILLKFMAIRDANELKTSRRVAVGWNLISLFAAISIGIIGRVIAPDALLTQATSENIFIVMAEAFFPPIFAGIVMAGILAATISSSDSYLLIAASSFSKNIYKTFIKKDATDREVLRMTRIALLVIALIGILIALDENSVIFQVVSFAWAGFGATFGPIILFSLFWKRTTRQAAIAGMVTGGVTVFVWKLLLNPLGGIFSMYELLPAFILSSIVIVVVSLMTPQPSEEIQADFDKVKNM